MQFTSSRRGARLARLLAVRRLGTWGFPRGGEVSLTVETVVAELCANAVLHGRVPGRDFHLAMRLRVDGVIRIEVADARRERVPVRGRPYDVEEECGRGLLLVEAMAARWGVAERQGVGKIVWCELDT
ncbi:ATP-binding protein [Streptomyces sp. WMMC500]|uniref:ATP-binding protein n=1 Tax=Streptomyces sp. WMMC500 TaxID=3015154 RepID=UPI00248B4B84|nr:ATP-binding protein [Streptomyces sp. WMMC500]WBB58650.1 ATP-binding protein [Streptomyces sp. WMMC500]